MVLEMDDYASSPLSSHEQPYLGPVTTEPLVFDTSTVTP
jgi:hypothetical protein